MNYNYNKMLLYRIAVVFLLAQIVLGQYSMYRDDRELPPSCQSRIYCESDFLHDVQISRVFTDSKTFVDKKLKYPEEEILEKYRRLKENNNGLVPSVTVLGEFINDTMEADDAELEYWTPPDFNENPLIIYRIADPLYQNWVRQLNHRWKLLARKIRDEVRIQQDRYSLIWVPNGFVIPGGRFKELYYWDTYWIVQGLMLCEMYTTARGVIDNIIYMVRQFGYMPNGARKYYLNRSQPPMLAMMAMNYYEATREPGYRESVVYDLEIEFLFWMNNRMVTFQKDGKTFTMFRYYSPSRGPRPESYKEDYDDGKEYETQEEKNDFYSRMKSGAESGWDFSSRWFITANNSNEGNLTDVNTPSIVPVDLNSILHVNARILSSWFKHIGQLEKAEYYKTVSISILNNIHDVMWREDKGVWFDWDLKNSKHREYFYVSNIVPLWTGSYNMPSHVTAQHVIRYLRDVKVIESDYSVSYNGTPTSMYMSSQQWDFPNAWPPLQAFIILGLLMTGEVNANRVAYQMAQIWLRSNFRGFDFSQSMYEKYDVMNAGRTGKGGEYETQFGFGWTNGVVFEILNRIFHNNSSPMDLPIARLLSLEN